MGRRGSVGPQVNLLRVVELLQTHITPALCHAVFGRVRRTERQLVWTLDALVRFWTAVILRAPTALSQALADACEIASPCSRGSRPPPKPSSSAVETCDPRSSPRCSVVSPLGCWTLCRRATRRRWPHLRAVRDVMILDGSRLAAIAHRLKLLWNDRAVVLPAVCWASTT